MLSRSSAAALVLLAGCSGGAAQLRATPLADGRYDATGIASWYGDEVAGNRTASGERFDPGGLTVAHRTLPFGSLVEVTALDTGRTIVARVNDRGPHRPDRLIDLSRGAARLLGTDLRPLATVRVRTLAASVDARPGLVRTGASGSASAMLPLGRYVLQVASFSDRDRAEALAYRLAAELLPAGRLWRVRLGPFASAQDAQRARDAVAAQGYGDAQLIPLP